MTVNSVFEKAMSLMDERAETGVVDAETTLVYQKNTPYIINILQSELLEMGDFYSTHNISRGIISPSLSFFDVKKHDDEDINESATEVCKAYYFETDAPGTVYIEDYDGSSWNILKTITVPSTVEYFTAYKGIFTPSASAIATRIRFSGDYYYNYRNVALFTESFESDEKVPQYRPYVKYEMPDDFSSTSQIVAEDSDYSNMTDYRWEGQKDLYVPYNFEGSIRIVYRPLPTVVTSLDSDISLDDVVASAILPYGLARELLATENVNLSDYFGQRFEDLKFTLRKPRPKGTQDRNDEYDASLSY